jgi:hypothetical protein
MSILIACNCGKRFKAADQFAGKRTKCPGCGQTLTIPGAVAGATAAAAAPAAAAAKPRATATANAAVARPKAAVRPAPPPPPPVDPADDLSSLDAAAAAEVFQPAARAETEAATTVKKKKSSSFAAAAAVAPPLSKRNRKAGPEKAASFSMSPGMIVLIVLAILIPSVITWVKLGPMKAHEEWVKISDIAESNIQGQIQRALLAERVKMGMDPNDIKYMPKVTNFQFDGSQDIFMIRMPEGVPFQGRTTEGDFHGTFHPKTYKFEVDVDMEGTKHALDGSASETDTSLNMDGQPVK